MKGYIAHPVLDRKMVVVWEQDFEGQTGIELVNPFTDVEFEDEPDLANSEAGDYSSCSNKDIVSNDINAILDSDFVVAFVTGQRSYGTIMEIVYAYRNNRPLYIICTNGHETHPWLVYHATRVFTSAEEFTKFMLLPRE